MSFGCGYSTSLTKLNLEFGSYVLPEKFVVSSASTNRALMSQLFPVQLPSYPSRKMSAKPRIVTGSEDPLPNPLTIGIMNTRRLQIDVVVAHEPPDHGLQAPFSAYSCSGPEIGVNVAVGTVVFVGVAVGPGVFVRVGVDVAPGVFVEVGGTLVLVGVRVGVLVGTDVRVGVGVLVFGASGRENDAPLRPVPPPMPTYEASRPSATCGASEALTGENASANESHPVLV